MKKNIYAFIVTNLVFVGVGFSQTTTPQIYTPNGTTVLPTTNNSGTTAGNVGIGIAIPFAKLDILSPNNGIQLRLRPAGGGSSTVSIPSYIDMYATFDQYSADQGPRRAATIKAMYSGGTYTKEVLAFEVGGSNDVGIEPTERMRIQANGNVGIGTTTPYFPLSVQTNTFANTKISLWDNGTATVAPTLVYGIGVQSNQFRFHLSSSTNRFTFLNAPAGTSSNELLTINGDGSSIATIRQDWKAFEFRSFNKAATMQLRGFTNAAGTTSQSLHFVIGNSNDPVNAPCGGCASNEALANDAVIRLIGNHPNSNIVLQNSNGGAIKFAGLRSGQERQTMEIKSDGRVIIGNYTKTDANDFVPGAASATFPDATKYKLIVATGILTPKVKITSVNSPEWADFVFEKNYKLQSLEEVEKYVIQHKHLPEVPSAIEVEKNGIDIAKMDATLLQKIEELTLHAIAQEKRINKLEALLKAK